MTKHTEKAGALPNAAIDFEKVQANAKKGDDNIFKGACTLERNTATDTKPSREVRQVSEAVSKTRADLAKQQGDTATADAIAAGLENSAAADAGKSDSSK